MSTATNPTASAASGRVRFDRKAILAGLNILDEFRELGVRFPTTKPNNAGWVACHAWGRTDDDPSAGCHIERGLYKDQKSDEKACSLFDLAVRAGKYSSIKEALQGYAVKAGLRTASNAKPRGFKSAEAAADFLASKLNATIGGTWSYLRADGSEAFRIIRFNTVKPDGKAGKTIRPLKLNEFGRWEWKQIEGRRPLYQLPEIIDRRGPVWVAEGEKCADTFTRIGCIGTTPAHGAHSPHLTDWTPLKDRDVYISPDNDKDGEEFAKSVISLIRAINPDARIKVVRLPNVGPKGDVADWVKNHPSKDDPRVLWDDLQRLLNQSPWAEAIPIDIDKDLASTPCTDLGNAERLVARHGQNLRYCHVWSKWLHWSGRHWAIDRVAEARRLAKDTVRRILGEAMKVEDHDGRKAVAQWAITSEKRDKLAAMLHLAEAEKGIPILPEDMDSDPWLFNVLNGTIDLRTGSLKPHDRDDRITKLCSVEFNPAASCPLWMATLNKFFAREDPKDTAELIEYFQRMAGYAMTGVVREQIMPVAYGIGSNGKSTVLGALLDVFGSDYAMKCPPDMLMAKKTDSHPTDRADLFGRRLVVAIETESGRRLNETMVKELTGNDRIRARRMREDFWEFSPTHKLIMATNHKPRITGRDNGIWRRIKLVPFTVTVSGAQANLEMPELLRAEASGILTWCVQGCLKWQSSGLTEPAEVAAATASYRKEQDVIGAFLDERTVRIVGAKVKSSALYSAYQAWCQASGEAAMTQTMFGTTLAECGIDKKHSGGIWYLGIGLRDDRPGDDEAPYE